MKPLYVGLMGLAGAGKDTVASAVMKELEDRRRLYDDERGNLITSKFNCRRYAFADPLKSFVSYVFDIPKVWLYDQELKKRELYVTINDCTRMRMQDWVRENIKNSEKWGWHIARPDLTLSSSDQYDRVGEVAEFLCGKTFDILYEVGKVTNRHGRFIVSVRKLLQYIGTELIRNNIDDKFWAEDKDKGLYDNDNIIFCPDTRFETEVDFIRSNEGIIVVIDNPELESDDGMYTHSSETYLDEFVNSDQLHYQYINKPSLGIEKDRVNDLAEYVMKSYYTRNK